MEYEVAPYTFRPDAERLAEEGDAHNCPAIRFEVCFEVYSGWERGHWTLDGGALQVIEHRPDEPAWRALLEEAECPEPISCAATTPEGKLAGSLAIRLQTEERLRLKSMGSGPGIQVCGASRLTCPTSGGA